jgi:hypothetical protein
MERKSSLTDGSQGLESFLYVVNEPKLGGKDVPHNTVPIYYLSYPTGGETQGIGTLYSLLILPSSSLSRVKGRGGLRDRDRR